MKKVLESLLLVALVGTASQGAFARQQASPALQALDDQLPGDLINDPSNMAWTITGKNMTSSPLRDATIPGGGAGLFIKVSAAGANSWDVQAQVPLIGPIEAGQPVTVGFYARTISAATADKRGEITIRVQQNVSPFAGFIDKTVPVGPAWDFYEVSARADRSLKAGEAVVALQFAGAKQDIQVGQMIVVSNATSIAGGGGSGGQKAQAAPDLSGPPTLPASLQNKGTLLVDPRKRDNWAFYGTGITRSAGRSAVMGVTSIKAVTAAKAPNPHEVAVTVPLDAGIKKGETIIISVAARTNASDAADGKGQIGVRVMENEVPWPGFGDNPMSFAAGQWQILTFSTEATLDIPAGKAAVQLQLGGAKQDLDLGPVFVIKAGTP